MRKKMALKLPPLLKKICCYTTLQNVNVHVFSFTFILVRIICFVPGGISFTSFYLLVYFISDTDVIMT